MVVISILLIGLLLGCIWLLLRVATKLDAIEPKKPIFHINVQNGGDGVHSPSKHANIPNSKKAEVSMDQFTQTSTADDSWLNKKIEDSNL